MCEKRKEKVYKILLEKGLFKWSNGWYTDINWTCAVIVRSNKSATLVNFWLVFKSVFVDYISRQEIKILRISVIWFMDRAHSSSSPLQMCYPSSHYFCITHRLGRLCSTKNSIYQKSAVKLFFIVFLCWSNLMVWVIRMEWSLHATLINQLRMPARDIV